VAVPPDDDVIVPDDAERFRDRDDLERHVDVLGRGRGIAGRMIVDHAQSLWITMVPAEAQSIIKAVYKIERALRFQ